MSDELDILFAEYEEDRNAIKYSSKIKMKTAYKIEGNEEFIDTTAMMVWEEELLRDKLGMDSLLSGALCALSYRKCFNSVVDGDRNPYYKWSKLMDETEQNKGAL